jgi:hypothetical protein
MSLSADTCTRFCHFVMRRLAEATISARPESPLRRAWEQLGDEYSQVAIESLKEHVVRELIDNAAVQLRNLDACGNLAVAALISTILADTITDIIRESQRRSDTIDTSGLAVDGAA